MSYIGRNDGLQAAMAADGEHLTIGGTTGLTSTSKRIPFKVASDGTLAVSGGSSVTPSRSNSSGLAASLVVKASAGTLYDIVVTNTKASLQYIQLFDSATVPADTAVPIASFPIAASPQAFVISFQQGMAFSTGIAMSNSSTAATKTIGSADCLITANYV
jgi:hypothetical protein